MKKSMFITAVAFAALITCTLRAEEPCVLAYWPFGENGLEDASGNGNTLEGGATITDCATFTGNVGSALSTIGDLNLSGCTNVTIEFFIKANDNLGLVRLLEHSSIMNSKLGAFQVNLNERDVGEHRLNALWNAQLGTYGIACIDTVANVIQDGVWHHVAIVIKSQDTTAYNAAAPENWCLSFYIDGVVTANMGKRTVLNSTTGPRSLINDKLYIGSRNNAEGFLIGQMDDIRVTAAALTPAQFLKARTTAQSENAVVAFWPFGTNGLMDVSGNTNHLHASTGVALGNDGALVFDGTQRFCQTYRPLDLRRFTEGLTIELWFKRSGSPSRNMPIIYHSASTLNNEQLMFGTCFDSSGQVMSFAGTAISKNIDRTSGMTLVDDDWHHLAWVVDPRTMSDTVRMYVDGILADIDNDHLGVVTSLGNGFLRLGCGHAGTTTLKLVGSIDDVRITATALSPEEFMVERTEDAGSAAVVPEPQPFTLAHWPFKRNNPRADETGLYTLEMPQSGTVDFADGSAVFTGLGGLSTVLPLDLMPYGKLTIEFWVNYPRIRDRGVVDKDFDMNFLELSNTFDTHSGTFRFSSDVGYMNAPARAGFLFKTSVSGRYRGHLQPEGTYGDGDWHHWVCKIDNSGAALSTSLSIDGVTVPVDSSVFNDAVVTSFASDLSLNIGWRRGIDLGTGTWKSFKNLVGKIDDVRISAGLLSDGDVLGSRSVEVDPVASPVHRWTFNGSNPLVDVAGGEGDFKVGSSIVCSTDMAVFDGTTGFETAKFLNLNRYKSLTLELLIRADEPVGGGTQMLMEYGRNYQEYGSVQFYVLIDGNGQLRAGLNGNYRYWSECRINRSEWTHLALVMDFEQPLPSDQVAFYVNGEKAPLGVADVALGGLRETTTLFLGARNSSSLGFRGAIDDVAISEGALRPGSFILSRPSPVNNREDVIAYWPFDIGHELRDASGNGYSLTNSSAYLGSGCALLSGMASLATDAYLPFNLCTGLTVECFVRIPLGGGQSVQTVFKTTDSSLAVSTGAAGVELDTSGVSPALVSRWISGCFKDASGLIVPMDNVDTTIGSAVNIADGMWHHVALVVDPMRNYGARSRLYVDRQEMIEYASCDADRVQAFVDGIFVAGAGFRGLMDDIRITGRALSPAEFLLKRTPPKGMAISIR